MKVTGQPGQVVQKRVFKQGRFKIVEWFRFDEKGEATLDDTKISDVDVEKLSRHFKVDKSQAKPQKVETPVEYTEEQIRAMAKDKGIKSWHTKSIKTLKGELNL